MEQITIEVLSQNTAAVAARVQNGETLEILKHGRTIARMVPVASDPPGGQTAVAAANEPPAIS